MVEFQLDTEIDGKDKPKSKQSSFMVDRPDEVRLNRSTIGA